MSDYHSGSLVRSVWALAADGVCSLAEAVWLVTCAPARLVGLTDRGRLVAGSRADLVAVAEGAVPRVTRAWVAGRPVFSRG